jgi:signal transduction histidine kinase
MVVIGFTAHDWARWLGYVDYDNMLLTPFAMPFLILALGGAIISSHIQAANALARSNVELEERVTDKARELEKVYEQMQLSQREQAVLQERQRIMGDMHDGLSANLVSLYNMVQSNNTDSTEVAYRLDETLRELRAIVDSLEPVEGDLGVVLGNIRYRMRTALEESGINLIWRVEELPTLADLKPEKILNIQRIVLEALTNALRHAAADTVSVSARAIAEENIIIITITDNGTGFDTSTTQGGRGLRNMHDRAMRIGIILHIDSKPGQGTTITLKLPITHN